MKCLICNIERQDLTQHIMKIHNMSIEDYKQKFNVEKVVDECMRKQRSTSRQRNNNAIICSICNVSLRNEKALKRHCIETRETKHSHIIFNETNVDDWIECKICSLRRQGRIDFHIKQHHSMKVSDYKKKYGNITSKNYFQKLKVNANANHESERFTGYNNPFYGKHHTKATRLSISKTTRINNAKLIKHFNKDRKHTPEACHNIGLGHVGEKNGRYGKPAARTSAFSIHGFRKDIGHYVASTYEANYARYLQYNNIKYEYEPKGFEIIYGDHKSSCWIDFHLIDSDEWVELKNYVGRDLTKFNLVKQTYLQLKARVLYQSSDEWKTIESKYSKLIPLWESGSQNLRNHPELYQNSPESFLATSKT